MWYADADPPGIVSLNSFQQFENELARSLGGTMSARCLGGQLGRWLMDGSDFTQFSLLLSIPTLTERNAGLYQCLVFILNFPEFDTTGTVASLYALIQGNHINLSEYTVRSYVLHTVFAVLDNSTLAISPSISQTFTLGLDSDLVSLNCSVRANPLPLLQWSRYNSSNNDSEVLDAVQAATGFNEVAFSILSLNISELGVGTHSFQCTATVNTPTTHSETSSIVTAVTINPLLQNISVVPEIQSFVVDGNTNDMVELNCSFLASPVPSSVQWSVNGVEILGRSVVSAGSIVFYSILELSFGELELGENNITCYAFQDAVAPPIIVMDTATITITSMLLHWMHVKFVYEKNNDGILSCLSAHIQDLVWILQRPQ